MAVGSMYHHVLITLVLVAHVALQEAPFDPYSEGSHETLRFNLDRFTTLGLTQELNIWSPIESGQYPLFYLLDSFGAITPGTAYDDTMSRIASHGFVVVNAWRLVGALSFDDKVIQFTDTVDWSRKNLENHLHQGGAASDLSINFNLTFGMGHSAGSHVLVEYLTKGCSDFKGIVLSSPVDGFTPESSVIIEGTTLNFDIPAIVLPAGLDNVKGTNTTAIPCAPDAISNLHFYNALNPNSPKWLVNATEYGHGDYMDQKFVDVIMKLHFCAFKENGTLEDFALYRSFVSGQVVSFLRSLIEDDCQTYLPFIEDLSAMPVLATGEHVNPSGGCPRAYCNFTPA